MKIQTTIQDLVGITAGVIGYKLSELKLVVLDAIPSIPTSTEFLHSCIMASFCAVVGFVTTKICAWIYKKVRRAITEFYKEHETER
ncbi:MAG: hypothetical protein MUE38_05795 [Flavihumibacter sp.]|jgi:hypothetical protein|nr:hypothetical protein [Flavihumibacter sp.]